MKRLQRLKESLAEYPDQGERRSIAQRSRSFEFPRRFRKNSVINIGDKQKHAVVALSTRSPRRNTIQIGSPLQTDRNNRTEEEDRSRIQDKKLSESLSSEETHSLMGNESTSNNKTIDHKRSQMCNIS